MRRAQALAVLICGLAAWPALADANLVVNPGFETGDFAGWILAGETRPDHSFVSAPGWNEWLPNAGGYFAALGAIGSDLQLSQTIATTPGETYRFRFFLGSDGETPNHFEALWNGVSVLSQTDAPETSGHDLIHGPPSAAYVLYSFTRVATGPTTTIQFNSRNDPGWRALDDVLVTPMPEPSSLALFAAGILGVAGCASRRSSCPSRPASASACSSRRSIPTTRARPRRSTATSS